ncbi:MAG: MBL fold metallo-hydrolase [Candidatus Omnitrophica bacterium]|nr:MBL fold metallo-hydrolase [Candidatus Omnitrophota bacterium]
MKSARLSIVYDNKLHDKDLQSGWGFSCLVECSDKKILFDTGDDPRKLSSNLKKMNINPKDFDAIVLSHNHWDHIDGLAAVLGKSKKCRLFFGKSFPESFRKSLKAKGIDFELVEDMVSVAEGVFAGPEMSGPGPKEIALTLQTDKGLVLITGCAHPGILEMAQETNRRLDKDIYLVLGGFHLGMSPRLSAIVSGLEKLGVKKAGPCHCSGDAGIALFKERFKEGFVDIGAGSIIEV